MNIKSFLQFLVEMPLPQDWNKEVFNQSFKKRLDYALSKATKIGTGTSRVAFIIPFENRETVVKIAKNAKGLAQNEKEVDYGLHRMHGSVLSPLIDHDEEHDPPTWVQFEKCEKMSKMQFRKATGLNFDNFGNMLRDFEDNVQGKNRSKYGKMDWKYRIPNEEQEQITESEIFQEVTEMCSNFNFLMGDFQNPVNWGLYKGQPVILDYGFDENVQKEYYK